MTGRNYKKTVHSNQDSSLKILPPAPERKVSAFSPPVPPALSTKPVITAANTSSDSNQMHATKILYGGFIVQPPDESSGTDVATGIGVAGVNPSHRSSDAHRLHVSQHTRKGPGPGRGTATFSHRTERRKIAADGYEPRTRKDHGIYYRAMSSVSDAGVAVSSMSPYAGGMSTGTSAGGMGSGTGAGGMGTGTGAGVEVVQGDVTRHLPSANTNRPQRQSTDYTPKDHLGSATDTRAPPPKLTTHAKEILRRELLRGSVGQAAVKGAGSGGKKDQSQATSSEADAAPDSPIT